MRLRSLMFLPAAALVLSACSGGDGSSAEAKPYVDSMVEAMSTDGSEVTEDDARCFSERFIDVVGIERVKKAGEPEDFGAGATGLDFADLELTRDEAGEVYDGLADCGQDPMDQVMRGLEDGDVSEEAKACVQELVSEDVVREVVVASLMGDAENRAAAEFSDGLMRCFVGDKNLGGTDLGEEELELGEGVDLGELEFEDLDLDSRP